MSGKQIAMPFEDFDTLDWEAAAATYDERSRTWIRYCMDPITGELVYWPHNAKWVFKTYSDAIHCVKFRWCW